MAWLRIDDHMRTHPKIVRAGVSGWVYFCGISYCREHLTDGLIPFEALPMLTPGIPRTKVHEARLVDLGLWVREPDGYRVHDFLDWNPTKAEVEETRAEEREKKRQQRMSRGDNDGTETGTSKGLRQDSSHVGAGAPARARASGNGFGSSLSEKSARETDGFEEFWAVYPRKAGKDAARKAFEKRHFTPASFDAVLVALAQQQRSAQWQRDGGQFIPHPATWLNQGRWQDAPESAPPSKEHPLQAFEIREALIVRRTSACHHTPECASLDVCVELIALERRREKVSA